MRLAFALLLLLATAGPAPAKTLRLRMVSWNLWGLPWGLASDRPARMAAIGPALLKLRPDLVLLQEVWVAEDGERLLADLAAGGLPYGVHRAEGLLGSGLLIASRFPLEGEAFERFRLGGKAHKLWHGDWYARKGALRVGVETPLGLVQVTNTHLHARYGSEEYLPVQITQALQVLDAVGDHGARPPARADDPARPPCILGGDLNSEAHELPFRLIRVGGALRPAREDLRIDWILLRDGGGLSLRARSTQKVLEEARDVGGREIPLSDHPAILSLLELKTRPGRASDPRAGGETWATVAAQALGRAREERLAAEARGSSARWYTLWLLGGCGLAYALNRRRKNKPKGRGCCLLAAIVMIALHLAVWTLYLGAVHEPQLAAGLRAAEARLEAR